MKRYLIQKVNYVEARQPIADSFEYSGDPLNAIDAAFERWAPDAHPGQRTMRSIIGGWVVDLRDGRHMAQVIALEPK